MLENVRFEPGETANDDALARAYARLADVYVNDAFGAAHRAHASTEGVAHHVSQAAAGRLLQREVETLEAMLSAPERPFVAVVGGAKVTDKIGVIDRLLELADAILVGGAMCFPFFRAQGHATGDSLCEEEGVEPARRALEASDGRDACRARAARRPRARRPLRGRRRARRARRSRRSRRAGWASTSAIAAPRRYAQRDRGAGTVFWNGPMGAFELEPFAAGTRAVAEAVAELRRARRSSAAATRSRRCTRSGSPTGSTTSRPAAARRSSSSRGARCPGVEALR